MSADERERVRSAMMDGRSRLVVSTTALSAGVNLPATHVLLRDTTFAGSGHLDIGQILQMMGRAGRGNQPGFAAALVRPSDAWHPDVLATDLEAEALPPLRSSFAPPEYDDQPWRRRTDEHTDTAASRTAALLARHPKDGMTQDDIQAFFTRSFGGKHLAGKVHAALDSLVGHGRRGGLAHKSDDGRYRLTALGLRAVRTMLPLPLAAGFAQLIRDLLSVDPEDKHILGWRPMDHLLLLDLLHDRTPSLRTFSEALAAEVDTWMDAHPHEEPLLFREWIRGDEENSKASQILGSLGISEPARGDRKTWARKAAYTSAFRAILLLERARGTPIPDLEKAWKAKNLAGVEERWRDDFLWLLSGLARILNPPCFTYHLRGRCEADEERERRVRSALRAMRHTAFSLAEELTYCSPLGGLLRTLRSDGKRGVGLGTLRRLEASGITSIDQLCDLGADEIARYGVRRDIAEVLATYLCAIPSDQP